MGYTFFVIGIICFGVGFILLLLFLYLKKKLIFPFIVMGAGVLFCFAGLLLAEPFTHDESVSLYSAVE